MDVKCQSRTRRVPVVLVAAIAVFNAFAAPIASQPQDGNQFAGPVCSVPPAPDADQAMRRYEITMGLQAKRSRSREPGRE